MKNNSHLTFLLLHTSFTTSFTTSFSLFFILIVRDVHIHINKIEINDHCHFLIPYSSCCSYNIYNVRICLRSYTTVQHISIVLHFLFSPLLSSSLCLPLFLPFQIRHFDREILKLLICDFFKAYYDMFAVRVSA